MLKESKILPSWVSESIPIELYQDDSADDTSLVFTGIEEIQLDSAKYDELELELCIPMFLYFLDIGIDKWDDGYISETSDIEIYLILEHYNSRWFDSTKPEKYGVEFPIDLTGIEFSHLNPDRDQEPWTDTEAMLLLCTYRDQVPLDVLARRHSRNAQSIWTKIIEEKMLAEDVAIENVLKAQQEEYDEYCIEQEMNKWKCQEKMYKDLEKKIRAQYEYVDTLEKAQILSNNFSRHAGALVKNGIDEQDDSVLEADTMSAIFAQMAKEMDDDAMGESSVFGEEDFLGGNTSYPTPVQKISCCNCDGTGFFRSGITCPYCSGRGWI